MLQVLNEIRENENFQIFLFFDKENWKTVFFHFKYLSQYQNMNLRIVIIIIDEIETHRIK